jgi:ATP-dependent Clp protease adapter protein ClpS
MGVLSRLKALMGRATAAPVTIPGLPFPVVFVEDPRSFQHGLELLNNERTPMHFVVQELQNCTGLSAGDASVAVAICHSIGGVVVPLSSSEAADAAARGLAARAAAAGFVLQCRAIAAPFPAGT